MTACGKNELLSVIMPVWNGEAYIRETVESVLRQNMPAEIIVVDDGSTDKSTDRIADLTCKVVTKPHSGIAATCNMGAAHASGNFILFLDQDDVMLEGSLRVLHDTFLSDPALQAVAGQAEDFVSPDLDDDARKRLIPRPGPYHGLMSGAVLLRREVFALVGGFDETYRAGQAVDFLLRMKESGIRVKKLDTLTVMRRLHGNNTSRTMKDKQFCDYGALLRAKLGRGRAHG